MRKRNIHNTNLTLHHSGPWRGYDVQLQRGPLFMPYLERIHQTMMRAIDSQARTMAVRLDLALPANGYYRRGDVIERFIQSLRAQIEADIGKRKREGRTAPSWHLEYVCAREQAVGLVHFSEGGTYWIQRNSLICDSQIAGLFNRLSYLAKESTKRFGHGGRNLRCSRP